MSGPVRDRESDLIRIATFIEAGAAKAFEEASDLMGQVFRSLPERLTDSQRSRVDHWAEGLQRLTRRTTE